MMVLYMIQFIDKTTLGNSVNLGLKVDNHLTAVCVVVLAQSFSFIISPWES